MHTAPPAALPWPLPTATDTLPAKLKIWPSVSDSMFSEAAVTEPPDTVAEVR